VIEHDDKAIAAAKDSASLAVAVGVLQERLAGIQRAIEHHMLEEHRDFQKALAKVEELHGTVRELHAAARVTRWIASIATGAVALAVWIKDHLVFK
jgi:hypothetical protein